MYLALADRIAEDVATVDSSRARGCRRIAHWRICSMSISHCYARDAEARRRALLAAFTDQELRPLIGFEPRTFNHWRVHALAAALFDTGCRIDEVIKLAVADVDMEDLLLTVYGERRKERKIPFSLELRKLLFR